MPARLVRTRKLPNRSRMASARPRSAPASPRPIDTELGAGGLAPRSYSNAENEPHNFARLARILRQHSTRTLRDKFRWAAPPHRRSCRNRHYCPTQPQLNVYAVTLPKKHSQGASYNIVGFPGSGSRPMSELVFDEPHLGKDWSRQLYLDAAGSNGATHTLMLRATRLWQNSISEPAITRFEILELTESTGETGPTPEYFASAAGLGIA